MIDRYILFEIPVTAAFLNFAFQPISRPIRHACQVCLFNPLKDIVGLHYATSCLPKCSPLHFLAGVLGFMRRCGWLGDVGCSAELQIGSPRLVSRVRLFRGNRHANNTGCVRVFPDGVASWRSVNNIMEMRVGFLRSHCLSWITRQSNEPVSRRQ